MSTYEQKAGTIICFAVEKEGNEKRPDFKVKMVTKSGEKIEGAVWWTESQNGLKYLSGKIDEPYEGGRSNGAGSHSSASTSLEQEDPF